jgi:F-type H+-transporting ATPase subunit a
MLMSLFAATTSAEPLAAEKIVNAGPLPVTNSMIYGLITAVVVLTIFLLAARASQIWPKSRLAYYTESLVELMLGLVTDSFGNRKEALRHFPLLISLFVFILACNLSGLLPGVGTVTVNVDGTQTALLRAFTTDLNSTLALAVLTITTVQVYAIRELGIGGHIRHYFHNVKNPMNIFIGLNEVFGEILRLVTLSLRLFGVIYGGEALLHAISNLAGNFGWAATLPIMFLEIFFSLVQAYLFMMLTTTYLVMATTQHEESHDNSAAQPAAAR